MSGTLCFTHWFAQRCADSSNSLFHSCIDRNFYFIDTNFYHFGPVLKSMQIVYPISEGIVDKFSWWWSHWKRTDSRYHQTFFFEVATRTITIYLCVTPGISMITRVTQLTMWNKIGYNTQIYIYYNTTKTTRGLLQ